MADVIREWQCSNGKKLLFVWDENKNEINKEVHGVSFERAMAVFCDSRARKIYDPAHSTRQEKRFYWIGELDGSILTVRFTRRDEKLRIIGAGFWREGYERYYLGRDRL